MKEPKEKKKEENRKKLKWVTPKRTSLSTKMLQSAISTTTF